MYHRSQSTAAGVTTSIGAAAGGDAAGGAADVGAAGVGAVDGGTAAGGMPPGALPLKVLLPNTLPPGALPLGRCRWGHSLFQVGWRRCPLSNPGRVAIAFARRQAVVPCCLYFFVHPL